MKKVSEKVTILIAVIFLLFRWRGTHIRPSEVFP
jgi:hypothetical protein